MFKNLRIYYLFVSLPFVLLLLGSGIFFNAIKLTITRNPHPQINYTIFVIILVGGTLIILNARRLVREAKALVEFSRAIRAKMNLADLQSLASRYTGEISCLLQMVAASGGRSISHQEQAAIEHELENTRASLIRRNALPQYLTGLLVGMGLLGTFIGLLATLNDISVLISSFADIDMQNANPLLVFRTMIERMKAPMHSMGIAFSASMFGLLGSIILGLMMVGIRRLQGDIFSLLSSEVARHIEIALSFESTTSRSAAEYTGDMGDVTKVLIRVEERLAETTRLQQRALSAIADDSQQQRAEMLRVLTEQTEANNNFHSELRHLASQLDTTFKGLEMGNGQLSAQISELTVHTAGNAKETNTLLSMQVEEQKKLRASLDSYKIEERLVEATRIQQRMLSSVIDDVQSQRTDMQRTLVAQTEASNNFRSELKQLGHQLGTIFNRMEKGSEEISTQISELAIHAAADAKESQLLLTNVNNTFRSELQQLGSQLGSIVPAMEKGNDAICSQMAESMALLSAEARDSLHRLDQAGKDFRSELQQLGSQLGAIVPAMKKGNDAICSQMAESMALLSADAKESLHRLDQAGKEFRSELQQLGSQLGTIAKGAEKGTGEICARISELMGHMDADAKVSHKLLDSLANGQEAISVREKAV